ncbi:unnamed protein product [Durusdinium trenchii]|uniref:Chalcone isomerase domain-containing protein n=1 Tax=Durusdinium trenchii TaxID=1381693 RepID=A0ABP0KLL8_9DINO
MSAWTASQDLLGATGLGRWKVLARHAGLSASYVSAAVGAALVVGDLQDWWPRRLSSTSSSSPSSWPCPNSSDAFAVVQTLLRDDRWARGTMLEGEEVQAAEVEVQEEEASNFGLGGFQFQDFKVLHGQRLKAHGCCHLKYYGFEVCVAVLYLPEDAPAPRSGAEIMDSSLPKILELRYCRSFPGEHFRWVTRWAMSRNGHPTETDTAEAFNALYRDVTHGDCYTLGYHPAQGECGRVSLQLNGTELGAVEGRSFSEAIFSVWFGPKPFLEDLKQELLRPFTPSIE